MSAARRYEVSFRAELDDRQCDEVADTLFELGWDDICFRPLPVLKNTPLYEWKICGDCGGRYMQWGSHAERCTGRAS